MIIKRFLISTIMKPSILVGGQAVIEGVMMRVPGAYATAVRDPEGNIQVDRHDFTSIIEKNKLWKKPILRGMISLYESYRSLGNRVAMRAMSDVGRDCWTGALHTGWTRR